ncbi:MAG: hypothetical protein KJ792_01960 [Actinobacteria bacterium]|nr:hypothetical protein [Actinomycetota bacterium]MCG2801710.1 hypothetical protein [Cellulomonas sp.]
MQGRDDHAFREVLLAVGALVELRLASRLPVDDGALAGMVQTTKRAFLRACAGAPLGVVWTHLAAVDVLNDWASDLAGLREALAVAPRFCRATS